MDLYAAGISKDYRAVEPTVYQQRVTYVGTPRMGGLYTCERRCSECHSRQTETKQSPQS